MSVLAYVFSNIDRFALVFISAAGALAIRALVVLAWQSIFHVKDYPSLSHAERDIGEVSGDSRIYVAETPRFQAVRKFLTERNHHE